MTRVEDTLEIEHHFIVQASYKCRRDTSKRREYQRALEKVVKRRCDTYEYNDEGVDCQWIFNTEKAARSVEKRLRAAGGTGLVTKLCKVTRLWAVKVLDKERSR